MPTTGNEDPEGSLSPQRLAAYEEALRRYEELVNIGEDEFRRKPASQARTGPNSPPALPTQRLHHSSRGATATTDVMQPEGSRSYPSADHIRRYGNEEGAYADDSERSAEGGHRHYNTEADLDDERLSQSQPDANEERCRVVTTRGTSAKNQLPPGLDVEDQLQISRRSQRASHIGSTAMMHPPDSALDDLRCRTGGLTFHTGRSPY